MVKHPIECVGLSAPPGSDRRKFQLLAQQLSGEAGKKRHDCGSLNQTASQCVGNFHVAGNDGVDETGYSQKGVATQFEWIAKAVIYASQNDVDLFEAVNGL